MATPNDQGDGGGAGSSWWTSWVQTAKEKTMATVEIMKKDLNEFRTTVQHDTGEYVARTASQIRDNVAVPGTSDGILGNFLGKVSQSFQSLADQAVAQDEEESPMHFTSKQTVEPYDRFKAQLLRLQANSDTYLADPTPNEKYQEWTHSFDVDAKTGDISQLLMKNERVRSIYSQMVPSQLSHHMFWSRYFFRVVALREEEEKRRKLVSRVNEEKYEDIDWDDEEDSIGERSNNDEPGVGPIEDSDDGAPTEETQHQPPPAASVRPEEATSDTMAVSQPEQEPERQELQLEPQLEAEEQQQQQPLPEEHLEECHEVSGSVQVSELQEASIEPTAEQPDADQATLSESSVPTPQEAGKESSSGDDWEKDFDIEVTEEDLNELRTQSAQSGDKKGSPTSPGNEDEWESWE